MRTQLLTAVAVIALGMSGAGLAHAHGPAPGTSGMPGKNSVDRVLGVAPTQAGAAATLIRYHARPAHLSPRDIRHLQRRLRAEGLYHGRVDGLMGPRTRWAIAQFQRRYGLPQTGRLDPRTMRALAHGAPPRYGSGPPPRYYHR
jgi:peptidoglycan hydrolase-like protein with peptidoglycan-binding domain